MHPGDITMHPKRNGASCTRIERTTPTDIELFRVPVRQTEHCFKPHGSCERQQRNEINATELCQILRPLAPVESINKMSLLDHGTHPHLLHALPEPCLAIAESSPSNVSFALNSFESENAGNQEQQQQR